MLKKMVGRLFGFEEEIEELRQQVKDLSWDAGFSMWTRGAFLQLCEVMPRGLRTLIFMDIDNVHGLNERYGYAEVDRRIRESFAIRFRKSDVVARWFSGDEIVILMDSDLDGANRKISELKKSGEPRAITFKFAIGTWDVGRQEIEKAVEVLSEDVTEQKRGSGR